MPQTTAQEKPPDFKLWVLYVDGNTRTYYSYPQDEKKGTALERLKNLVLMRWAGRVAVAKIYRNDEDRLILQYHNRSDSNTFKPVTTLPEQSIPKHDQPKQTGSLHQQ